MSWTYSGDPASSPKDEVRFLIGDTDVATPFLSDEEIGYALAKASNSATTAAIRALEAIIYRLASKAYDQSLGAASISYSKVLDNFRANLKLLRENSGLDAIAVYAGGIDRLDEGRYRDRRLTVQPEFTKHMFENSPYPKIAARGLSEGRRQREGIVYQPEDQV